MKKNKKNEDYSRRENKDEESTKNISSAKSNSLEISKGGIIKKGDITMLKAALIIFVLYFICGYLWYISIAYTSISANTAIYNSCFLFVAMFEMVLLKEKMSIVKAITLLISLGGVLIVAFSASGSDEEDVDVTWYGYVFVILSTILNAFYEVFFKVVCNKIDGKKDDTNDDVDNVDDVDDDNELDGILTSVKPFTDGDDGDEYILGNNDDMIETDDSDIASSFLFLGSIGLFTGLIIWPGLFVVDYLGFEEFEWPTSTIWSILLLNIFWDCLQSIAILIGILFTNPLFIAIGCLTTIPASMIADLIIHNYTLPFLSFVGIFLIILGFILLNILYVFKDNSKTPSH
eukprot:TRINITY_DN6328_c0_g1_i2.p1 TRINITY_DN6328_c0_g1~~TRINITY_DN6328_c0_g1_i2.p1  ORF type:complete len:346 (+),score=88.21 TRINITY_DN6328_c0_g1_i2:474-1511(+)